MKLIIYTDGASRGNPGPSSYGFVISDQSGKILYEEGEYIGITTNNVAEYTAVLKSLEFVKKQHNISNLDIELCADSKLVAEQLSGRYKIKARHLKSIIEKIKGLASETGAVIFTHVPRAENIKADKLANLALDSRN